MDASQPWAWNPVIPIVLQASRAPASVRPSKAPRSELVAVSDIANVSLGEVTVCLPAAVIEEQENVTYFAIDVKPADGRAPWRVMRRYNHFRLLRKWQRWHCPRTTLAFPGKTWSKCTGDALESRRRALESWLSSLVYSQSGLKCDHLMWFLCVGRFAVSSTSPQPQLFQPSAPFTNSEASLELLQVTVPSDAQHGQLLAICVPDGKELKITVPWGTSPGATLQLWWDSVASTLSVHPEEAWQALAVAD
jgi:hypothetical protein